MTLFSHILVPLDGSEMAESALPAAAFLAELFEASVTLIHVVEEHAPSEVHGEHHLTRVKDAEDYLGRTAQGRFKASVKVDCHVHATLVTDVARAIVDHQTEFDHDLIVMCTHGRSGVNNLLLGSIAQKVITHGTVPVLIVRPFPDQAVKFSISPILVPLDGRVEHEVSLSVAKELSAAVKGSVHLLMVIPTFTTLAGRMAAPSRFLPGTTERLLDMAAEEAVAYIEGRRPLVAGEGVAVTTAVERGEPAHVISRSAERTGSRLIILGTHGKAGIDAIAEGSVGSRVSSQVSAPVLLIPLPGDEPP